MCLFSLIYEYLNWIKTLYIILCVGIYLYIYIDFFVSWDVSTCTVLRMSIYMWYYSTKSLVQNAQYHHLLDHSYKKMQPHSIITACQVVHYNDLSKHSLTRLVLKCSTTNDRWLITNLIMFHIQHNKTVELRRTTNWIRFKLISCKCKTVQIDEAAEKALQSTKIGNAWCTEMPVIFRHTKTDNSYNVKFDIVLMNT